MRKALKIITVAAITGIAVFLSTATAYACPPWFFYQPKAPKSLIR